MKSDLDTIKGEIERTLEDEGFAIFYGYPRFDHGVSGVDWDADEHPNFRPFLAAAKRAGAQIVVFNSRQFSEEELDEAFEQLEEADLTRDEKRDLERRLREMRAYEGFTCMVQLSFMNGSTAYFFTLEAEWYTQFDDILEELDAALSDDEESGPVDGYFSRN